jgi:ABC-type antimicrobial peptide transport system permease subunit
MALTGLYGVIAYSVSRRTHEMGIRMALGATAPQIRALVLRQTAPIILTGLALGTLAAAFTPLPDNLLYGVERHDPATLCSVATLLALSALAAVAIPARRATQVDPIAALRRE